MGERREAVAQAALNHGFVREVPVVMVLSAVAARTAPRFGAFTDRLSDMEVGHLARNVSLQAVAPGLGTVVVAAIREGERAAALRIAEGERPIYLMPLGRPGDRRTTGRVGAEVHADASEAGGSTAERRRQVGENCSSPV